MREAVFSSLAGLTPNARFFDLFAGSGAYGLEAWSRGAEGGVFVEKNRGMVEATARNIEGVARSLKREADHLQVVLADVMRWSPREGERAGLIFVDPPYEIIPAVTPSLFGKFRLWLEPGGIVVFEMPGGTEIDLPGWECFKRLGKGRQQPSCCFFRRVGYGESAHP